MRLSRGQNGKKGSGSEGKIHNRGGNGRDGDKCEPRDYGSALTGWNSEYGLLLTIKTSCDNIERDKQRYDRRSSGTKTEATNKRREQGAKQY